MNAEEMESEVVFGAYGSFAVRGKFQRHFWSCYESSDYHYTAVTDDFGTLVPVDVVIDLRGVKEGVVFAYQGILYKILTRGKRQWTRSGYTTSVFAVNVTMGLGGRNFYFNDNGQPYLFQPYLFSPE